MEKRLEINGKKIFYRVVGEGRPVFLVHGFGEDGAIWKNQYERIKGFQFFVPDLPGSGQSEIVNDMSMEGMAGIIHAMVEKELEPSQTIDMIGHSMGGYISLAFADKYPSRLEGLGLFHSSAFPDSDEKIATRKKGIDFIQTHGAFEFLKTLIPSLYGPVTKEENPGMIEEHINSAHNFSGAAIVSYYVSMIERPDRTHILKTTKLPVLLVMGRFDQAIPLKDGLKQSHMAELSYIQVLERSGHMGMVEEINRSNELIINYLNRTEKTAQPE
jgi:pimeloyl-ACP methyl ester carboxylesterase